MKSCFTTFSSKKISVCGFLVYRQETKYNFEIQTENECEYECIERTEYRKRIFNLYMLLYRFTFNGTINGKDLSVKRSCNR